MLSNIQSCVEVWPTLSIFLSVTLVASVLCQPYYCCLLTQKCRSRASVFVNSIFTLFVLFSYLTMLRLKVLNQKPICILFPHIHFSSSVLNKTELNVCGCFVLLLVRSLTVYLYYLCNVL